MLDLKERRIGLIAGSGDIPVYFADKASKNGACLISIGFSEDIRSRLAPFSSKHFSIGIGQTGKILQTLRNESISELIIMGKVDKALIFKPQMFDFQALKFLTGLRNREDKTVMEGIIHGLEDAGFRVLDQREALREIFPAKGMLTRRKPGKKELEDIEFGFPIAKRMADMEIGQTLVVKNQTVVAVEAVEGTDRALERGCQLSKGKAVALKVSRSEQDYRYDCPGVGPQTIETLIQGGASVLALEAERIMVANQEEVVRLANEKGLSIVCV